jgi:predicted kinase
MKSLQLTKPHLIVVVGVPGSGKTFFAEQFAETFSAPYINYADLHTILHDSKIADEVAEYTLDQIFRTKQTLLIEGRGNAKVERQTIAAQAKKHGYEPLFIWVQTEPVTAKSRALKQSRSSDEFDQLTKKFTPLAATEKYVVISGKHTYASQAKVVLKKLASPRATIVTSPLERPRARTSGRITIN